MQKHKGFLTKYFSNVRYQLIIILLVTLVIAYIDRVNISILVVDPTFQDAMGLKENPTGKGWLMTAFLITYGVGNIVLSPIGDWMGPRKAMLLAIVIWSAALISGGLASSLAVMLLARVLLGAGESLHWPMQSKFVKDWFPANERGRANATWLIGLNVAPLIAMPLFTWMIPLTGWRGNFFFLASLGIIPLILIYFFTADTPEKCKRISQEEKQYIKTALDEEAQAEKQPENASVRQAFLVLIKNPYFWLLTIAYTATSSVWWGTLTWLPTYLKEAQGFDWAAMGMLSTLPYFISVIVKLLTGYALDKLGNGAYFLVISLGGSALCVASSAYATVPMVAAVSIAFGIGLLAMASPVAWSLLQAILPSRITSAGSGLMTGVANALSAFSPVAMGAFIRLSGSYEGGLMYLVGCALLGALASVVLIFKGRKKPALA